MLYTKNLSVSITDNMNIKHQFDIEVKIDGIFKEQAEEYISVFYNIDEAGEDLVSKLKDEILSKVTITCNDNGFNEIVDAGFWYKAKGFVLLTKILESIASDNSLSIDNSNNLRDLVEYYNVSGSAIDKAYDLFILQLCGPKDFIEYLRLSIKEKAYIISCYEKLQGVNVSQRVSRLEQGISDVLDLSTNENDVKYKREVNTKVQKLYNDGIIDKKDLDLLSTIDLERHNKLIKQAAITNNNKNDWNNDELLGPNSKW